MAKNNQQGCCVFDALAKVVYYQFGISLTIDDEVRFEKHHKKSGFKGIHIEKMPEVINDLMKPHKIRVNAIYAEMINDTTDKAKLKADGMDEFFLKLVKFGAVELKKPVIVCTYNHAEAFTGSENIRYAGIAFELEKIQ